MERHVSNDKYYFELFKILHLTQNMRLQALIQDGNDDEYTLRFPSYLLRVCKGKLQVNYKKTVLHPSSVKCFTDFSRLVNQILADTPSNYKNENWMRERLVLTTRNIQLEQINW